MKTPQIDTYVMANPISYVLLHTKISSSRI